MPRDKVPDKEIYPRFGLRIAKLSDRNNDGFLISSQNEGIPNAEVLLIVEAWLEKMKDGFKEPIKDNMSVSIGLKIQPMG